MDSAAAPQREGSRLREGPAAAKPLPSPRAVTRGEINQRVSIDWLHATFESPALSVGGFIALLARIFGRPIDGQEGGGLLGFASAVKLVARVASRTVPIGFIAFGGESQNGRWLLQLTGAGCGLLDDWDSLSELLQGLGAKLTRVDLACDFLDGRYSVDDAVRMHEQGLFSLGSRPPSCEVAGDWLERKGGRTLYIGKAKNGKMLRVYEKGKQLGDATSQWVRFEVQLGNRDRVIPFEVLSQREAYFAGCYPALEALVADAGERIETMQTSGMVSLSHLMSHLKRSYGKLIDAMSMTPDFNVGELVQEVRVYGLPRRLNPSSMPAGLTWAQVIAQFKRS